MRGLAPPSSEKEASRPGGGDGSAGLEPIGMDLAAEAEGSRPPDEVSRFMTVTRSLPMCIDRPAYACPMTPWTTGLMILDVPSCSLSRKRGPLQHPRALQLSPPMHEALFPRG
jgi:hypothetical protein